MTFSCGCTDAPTYCATHAHWLCHDRFDCARRTQPEQSECPPCRLARLRSVSLSSSATPTRERKS